MVAVVCKWCINREIGRYAVCSGKSIFDGFATLPGPKNWAVWAFIVPQYVVAVATIAGLASSAATAARLALELPLWAWTLIILGISTALVLAGRYNWLENGATWFGIALAIVAVVAAASVLKDPGQLAAGLIPQIPDNSSLREVLPWLAFALSGAAGMTWYSYWLSEKRYGLPADAEVDPRTLDAPARRKLRGWLRQLTLDNTVAVLGTLIIVLGFLILGAELLRPQGLVPEEERVAAVLGRLFGGVWGPLGYGFMIAAVGLTFFSTTVTNQDGWARMLGHGTHLMARGVGLTEGWTRVPWLRRVMVVVVVGVAPVGLFLWRGNPVSLLQIAGLIEAIQLPILAGLAFWVNRRNLPRDLQAGWPATVGILAAAVLFSIAALAYVVQLIWS